MASTIVRGAGLALCLLLAAPARAAERQVLRGHVPAAVGRAQPLGPLASTRRLDLAIGLPLRNRPALTNLLQQLYDPASPIYHQYLTPEQFTERFGPTKADYQALLAFATANGLTVTATHPNRTLVEVNASVAAIEKVFHVTLREYQHPTEGRSFYAPDVEPSLDLAVPVLAISGLDDFILPGPMDLKGLWKKASQAMPYTTGSGPRGQFLGKDFRAAYAPGVSLDGSGQAVGLFELDGYYPSDITDYESLAGLPNVPLTNVLVNGVSGAPSSRNIEVALDIDMVICMAPGLSKVIVYEGRIPNDVLNRMATDNQARQLSSSWRFGPQVDATRDQIFQQFAAQGQSLFQASGDLGAYAGAVAPPSDDPFLTVVGGTSLTTSGAGGAWVSETVWPGSGGGSSTSFALPSWQQGLSTPTNQASATMRNLPDVACLADLTIWMIANNGEHGVVGGTSAAAPLWAGFTALVNQQAALNGQPSVGFINPALYALGQGPASTTSFHDITTGNNTNSTSPNKFFAVPGYDLCTGWGTPNGNNLIAALLAPLDALQITPATPLTFTGPVGGPFGPTTLTYSLTNAGAAALTWQISENASWLFVSPGGGTLSPGGPATNAALRLTLAANTLAVGSYPTTLWFTNLSDNFAQSRQVALAVVAPPVITSQPTSQTVFEGATAIFSVGTATNGFLFYQWQLDNGRYLTNLTDGGNISGAATSTLTLSDVSAANVGAYSVIVSNVAGVVTSSNAFLTLVPWRPIITAQPVSQTALPGQTVTLTVAAVGTEPLFYHWRRSGTNLTDGGNISGAATSTLTLANVSPADTATYSVLVSNALGSATSTGATLTVPSVTAPGTTLAMLHSFTGGNDGANPNGLVQGTNGNFYGTTQNGGANASGSVFQMSANGALLQLYSFTGGNDGATPYAALAQGPDGNFYGTTFQGGAYDLGTVFRIASNGALATLVSFNITNGDLPYAGLTPAADGNFYGTTYQGGNSSRGTVYRMSASGALNTLYSFTAGNDGGLPFAGLVACADGNLYGTTYKGGAYGYGTVFGITTNGALTSLASFNNTNGSFPYGGLAQGVDQTFYGATATGGNHGSGTVFRMTRTGLLTNLYSFSGGSDGSYPAAGLLQSSDGNFYGTTTHGGAYGDGTVFRLSPDGTLATLLTFDGYNGANPQTALVQGTDGSFYGTTQNGGASGQGTIFRLTITGPPQITSQPARQTVFTGANVRLSVAVSGRPPFSYQWFENGTNLIDSGNLSGSATRTLVLTNVTPANAGTYSVLVSNAINSVMSAEASLQVLVSAPQITAQPTNQTVAPGATATFTVTAVGNLPLSYQWQINGTKLMDGANLSGSAASTLTLSNVTEANNAAYTAVVSNILGSLTSSGALLTVVPVSAPGTRLATLHWFSGGNEGGTPNALMQATNGIFYGTTEFGGANQLGLLFKMTTNGTLTTLASFDGTNGGVPRAALVQGVDGNLYGTSAAGGTNSAGNVFKLAPDGTPTNLYSFTGGSDGANPSAALVQGVDGSFYGTAQNGGAYGFGDVFKLAPDGALVPLYSFTNGLDGASPAAELVQGTDGNFYGMSGAGAYGKGNVFRITPGGALANIYSFTGGADGSVPAGALVRGTDGYFYGATKYNTIRGYPFYGTIFKITPGGTLTTLYSLNFYDGIYPSAGLIQGSDGNFYGTTYADVAAGYGTLFRVTPDGALVTLVAFDGFDDGAHPAAALVEGADGSLYGTTTTGGPGGQGTIFRLSITSSPQITSQPANQVALVGANARFSVAVFGAPPLTYQWLRNGTNLTDGANLSGAATRVLNLNNVSSASAGTYSVIVSNNLNSVTSAGALLTVVAPPVFQTITKTNTTLTLTWSASAGQRYRLQFKPDLGLVNWTNLGGFITATGSTVTASDVLGTNVGRFYRVALFPQALAP